MQNSPLAHILNYTQLIIIMKTIQAIFNRPWLYLLIVVIGIALKFGAIDSRYFWWDEVSTIMHTSGITGSEYMEAFPQNEIRNISYYNDFLHLKNHNYTVASQLKGIWNMTNLNPLHYGILVFWYRLVGDEDIHYRLFNVFMLILTLPFLFLLSKLLFKSSMAGWIAISIMSVSPFFHNYSIEARYNILCAFLIIVNQYVFLKATISKKYAWWIGYVLSGILVWYSSFTLGLIFMGHLIYILISERKSLIPYFIGSTIIFLAYLPWLISIINSWNEINNALQWHEWYGNNQNIFTLFLAQIYFTAYSFVTFNEFFSQTAMFIHHNFSGNALHLAANLLVVALLIYAVIYTYKKADRKLFTFLTMIILPYFTFCLVSDLIRHSGIILAWRYSLINIIGIMLFMVYLFSDKISSGKYFFSGVYLALIVFGLISINHMKDKHYYNMFQAEENNIALLSECQKPLLISDMKTLGEAGSAAGILTFTNGCKSDNIDILRVASDVQNIEEYFNVEDYSDILVLNASQVLINNLKTQLGKSMKKIDREGFMNEWEIRMNANEESVIDNPTSEIKFIVVPKILPPSSTIYITGNHHLIGNWVPNKTALEEKSNGSWRGTFEIETGIELEYKFTRGDWDKESVDEDGRVMPNYKLEVQKDTSVTVTIENWKDLIK